MEGIQVPRTYEDGFRDALLTFRHQWSGQVNSALHIKPQNLNPEP